MSVRFRAVSSEITCAPHAKKTKSYLHRVVKLHETLKLKYILVGVLILCIACIIDATSSSNDASLIWLQQKAQTQGVISLPSGVMYKILRSGKGKFHPTDFSYCVINYRAMYINETEFFSSSEKNSSFTFRFTDGLDCWRQVLPTMVEGDYREIYSPSELCHGEMRFPHSLIPSGDAIIFQLTLLKITAEKSPAHRCNFDNLQGCDDGEKGMLQKYGYGDDLEKITKEITRLKKLVEETVMKDELRDSMAAKVSFLERLLTTRMSLPSLREL